MISSIMEVQTYTITPSGYPFGIRSPFHSMYNPGFELPAISETNSLSGQEKTITITLREQSRIQRLQLFLRELVRKDHIDHYTASISWKAWRTLSQAMNYKLLVPDVAAGADRQILFSWDHNEHHFELEVYPSGLGEFFYLNHTTNLSWELEAPVDDFSLSDVRDYLSFFLSSQ